MSTDPARPRVSGGQADRRVFLAGVSALTAIGIGIGIPAHAQSQGPGADRLPESEPLANMAWSTRIRLDHHDDAVPLRAHGDDDEVLRRLDPRPGRNSAWIDDELRLQLDRGPWSFGALARSRLDIRVDADTLALIRHVDRDEPLPAGGQHWRVDARAAGFAGRGLLIGWRTGDRSTCDCAGWVELQGLQLTRWIERRWTGDAARDANDGRYSLSLQGWRRDDHQIEPFLATPAGQGQAWLLAGGFRWAMAPGLHLSGSLHDLGGLRWRGIVEETSTVSTDTDLQQPDGQITLAPLMQGRVRSRPSFARAPAWAQLRLDSRLAPNVSASVSTRWGTAGQGWWQFAWRQVVSPGLGLQASAHSPAWPVRRWGLEVQARPHAAHALGDLSSAVASAGEGGAGACSGWSIGVTADRLSSQRRSAAFTLGWRRCG
ncbi:MAG: hypothetical protein RLZZ524_1381 [Pseudomonadota bacterium]